MCSGKIILPLSISFFKGDKKKKKKRKIVFYIHNYSKTELRNMILKLANSKIITLYKNIYAQE